MLTYPIIFVPGITASTLRDIYPLPSELIWTVLHKDYRRIAMHPNDLRYEGMQPAMVAADQVFEVSYKEMIAELRDELQESCGNTVPVYPFAYDWRQPLETAQQQLADFIQEVIARTRLLPQYQKAYGDDIKVNLLGHSMGGLVITRCLSDQPAGLAVNKVATLATPFQGSFEAIVKLTVGTGNLVGSKPSHAERRTARVMPALYQLLPAFTEGLNIEPSLSQDLFDMDSWQPSVLTSITKYVKETALPGTVPSQLAKDIFGQLLEGARHNAAQVRSLDLGSHHLDSQDWLAIVGVDSDTRIHQSVKKRRGKPVFEFDHRLDVKNNWRDSHPSDDWWMTGDGTVPYKGARPPFLSEDQLVLISPEDYAFWEMGDKALTKLGGFHGILPNMNLVHRILLRFFTDGSDKYGNTWGRAVPGVAQWNPPLKLKRRNK